MSYYSELNVSQTISEIEELYEKLAKLISIRWENKLKSMFMKARRNALRRSRKPINIFKPKYYLTPANVRVLFPSNIRVPVTTVSNAAIAIKDGRISLYLRISTLGSWFDRTFIAKYSFTLGELLEEQPKIEAKLLLPGIVPYECVEDPRVDPEDPNLIFHVRALYSDKIIKAVTTFEAEISGPIKLKPILFEDKGEILILRDYRDTFPLNSKFMLIRPYFRDLGTGGIFIAPRRGNIVIINEISPLSMLMPLEWEEKTGGNCVVKLGSNEYMLIYHSRDLHGVYRCYAVILDSTGEIISYSPNPILMPDPKMYSGRRPGTVFPCGAIIVKDKLYISAGVCDEIVVIYEGELEKLLEHFKQAKTG